MTQTETQTVPSPTGGRPIVCPRLHHTGTYTTRVDEMVDWYGNVLGMRVVLRSDNSGGVGIRSAYVTNDDYCHHRGGFQTPPGLVHDPDAVRHLARIGHYAWEYETIGDLLESWERLKEEHGIEPTVCVDHGVSFAFYYKDPDGNTVELLTDAMGDLKASLAYMESPQMVANPMGKHVVPAQLMAAYRAGADLAELHRRSMAGEFEPDPDTIDIASIGS